MERYYAKLLLFGEYTIIKGSQALAMPLRQYSGSWQFAADDEPIRYNLEEFVQYLMRLKEKGELLTDMDLRRFEREVNRGLYFESDIPVGYGAGSSGALCAAVYHRFARQPFEREDEVHYVRLKQQLAQLEGYFHGASSGVDPLICYLDHAVLLLPNGQARRVAPAEKRADDGGTFFLLDTGISRKTGPLVEKFLLYCEHNSFSEAVKNELAPATEKAIGHYLAGQREALLPEMHRISAFQYQHFQEMIPSAFYTIWKEGLHSGAFYLKLCGAGGGGFLLGYCQEEALAKASIKTGQFIPLPKI
ncbi:MAG: mevalonate kinase [Lewinellaceae bacterium]|nr:mevalonate kinase [Phaeodactylibacter sp.]MCB0613503.1 mevalonate kinase [Phaeodactylibacter sp.]MCB9347365.1 mevalonate kinase [Lewinellaceae bacterium]